MNRRAILAAVAAAALVGAAAGCGGEGKKPVVRVGQTTITHAQLEQTVEHFREEANREGTPFAEDRTTEKQLLGLLVYRARLEEGARALGVAVTDEQVEQRVASATSSEEKDAEAFAEASMRAQLLTEAVYRRLAGRVHISDPEQAQAARNTALQRWVDSLAARYPVREEAGD